MKMTLFALNQSHFQVNDSGQYESQEIATRGMTSLVISIIRFAKSYTVIMHGLRLIRDMIN